MVNESEILKEKKKRTCRISYMLATNRRKRLIHSITLKFVNISICQRHQKKLAIDWNMIFAGHKIEGLVINLNKEVPINQDKKKLKWLKQSPTSLVSVLEKLVHVCTWRYGSKMSITALEKKSKIRSNLTIF